MDSRRPPNPRARPVVLVVEGDDHTRALYALALSAMGFDVIPVEDGTEACHRAAAIRPDIIVTDLPMPNNECWELLCALKEDPRTREIPVVAMSGYAQHSVQERAQRDRFAAFFPKPCLPHQLAAGLRQVLEEKS